MTSADVSFAVDGLTVGAADLGGEPEFRFAVGTVLHDADLGEQLTRTASGTVATAATAYAGAALRSVAVKGRSVQDGTPTPDAPVAVESVDDLELAVAGRNLIIGEYVGLFLNSSTQKVATSAGAYTYVAHVPRETAVTLSINGGNRCVIGGIASPTIKSGDSFSPIANRGTISDYTYTFNTGANAYVALFVTTSAAEVSDVQLELGSAATAYVAPAVGTSATLDLDGHALRSLPDGTCDEAVWTADGGTLTQRLHMWNMRDYANSDWRKSGSASNGFYIQISNLTTAAVKQAKGNLRCSAATAVDTASAYYTTTNSCFVDNSFNFNLDPAVVGSTVAEFKAWLADHDLWVVAEMAEPTTAELPTSPLPDAPAADMAVWAECEPSAEVDVEYRESIQLAVDEIREAIASIV
jgi:hypothetical protein